MTTDEFWKIIDDIQPESTDMERKCAALKARLSALPSAEIRSFADHYWHCRQIAFHWPLWDAASLIYGGCGDDTFMDFRSSLITFGRSAFERALADPDTLAELPEPVPTKSGVYAAIHSVVSTAVGSGYRPTTGEPPVPTGTSIEDVADGYEDLARQHFPKLAARYLPDRIRLSPPPRPWWKFW